MSGIKYNKTSFEQATLDAANSKVLMDETLASAQTVSSTQLPSSFPASEELKQQVAQVTETCETGGDVENVFGEWGYVLSSLEDGETIDEVTWGSYFNLDDSLLIYVNGNAYPIDQYVIGVLDGEHEAMKAYTQYYHGEITYNQMMEFLKAFAIMARSYCLAQTIYSDYNGGVHKRDHVIQNDPSSKQCFNTRLFVDRGDYADWSGVAAAAAKASLETTGMVYAQDGKAISTYFTSNTTAAMLEMAKQGLNYKEILDTYYKHAVSTNWKNMGTKSPNAKLSYVDYSTEQILGEVPATDMVSSRVNVNLKGSAVLNVPYKSGDRTGATQYTGQTGASAEKVEAAINTYGPGSSGYSSSGGSGAASGAVTSAAGTGASTAGTGASTAGTGASTSDSGTATNGDDTSSSDNDSTNNGSTTDTDSTTNEGNNTGNDNSGSSIDITGNVHSNVSDVQENRLPTKEFEEHVPFADFGDKLSVVDDTSKVITYNVNDIDQTNYTDFSKSLEEQGYVQSANNNMWYGTNTLVQLVYDEEQQKLILKVYDKSKM